ncbi:hypothetical protein GE061_016478 [Apolygus lucorum]|uniref:Ionotropic glutamate receptor C-terminal domain-containing protein n=1 Tax=Apolygus lucorum TaxID=248454 RepID=A0A8S9XHF7_APOLU|nr:hypothetical protein GE061_016478 [Apolygus lucorum]
MSNCSITPVLDDDEWGHIYPTNHSGTGCAGQVFIGNADFCVGANYAWIQFWPFLDFSAGYFSGELTVIVPRPDALGGWSTPFLPFSAVLWAMVIFCTILSTVGLYLITWATLKYVPSFRERILKNDKFLSPSDSFVRSVGMLVLQQPQQLVPGSPVRHLFTALEIVYLVVTTCYAAELYDYLTVPRTQRPIENIHDMADSNLIWMGSSDAYLLIINNTNDPKTLKAVDNFRILPDEQIIALAESGGYGIVVERLMGGHFVELPYITDKFVKLSITMKQAYVQSPLFTYLRKGSPYTKRLNSIIGRMLNAGLMYKWEDDCSAKLLDYSKQQKLLASTRKVKFPPKVLKVDDLEGAFLVYFIGIILSIVVFVVEVCRDKRKSAILQKTLK